MFGQEKYKETNSVLNKKFDEKKILIAQHRGAKQGNVVENTNLAIKVAYLQGADIVEIDVAKSTDGVLYSFHDTTEDKNLRLHLNIEKLSSSAIDELTQYNSIWEPSKYKVQKLEDIITTFNNGELFNFDRTWGKLPETFALLKKHPSFIKQVILKGPPKKEILDVYENEKTKFMYMSLVKNLEELELVLSYKNINLVGLELICRGDDDPLFQDELINKLHDMGLLLWINVITLSNHDRHILSSKYDDNKSLEEGYDKGWGKIIDKKFDILLSDWSCLLSKYRDFKVKEANNEK